MTLSFKDLMKPQKEERSLVKVKTLKKALFIKLGLEMNYLGIISQMIELIFLKIDPEAKSSPFISDSKTAEATRKDFLTEGDSLQSYVGSAEKGLCRSGS